MSRGVTESAHILFVAYHFAPESASGTHRALHFARALVDAGHAVSVLTGPAPPPERSDPGLVQVFPWPDRVRRVDPPGSLGTLYVRWKRRRRVTAASGDGADPRRPPPRRVAGVRRALAVLRYQAGIWEDLPDHHRAWARPAVRAGVALGRRTGCRAVFASGPPWTGVMVGHRIAARLRVPFIADFRDPWTAGTGATWCYATEWAQRRAVRWEAAVLEHAALVCFNSPRLAAVAARRSGTGTKTQVILNGSDVPRTSVSAALSTLPPLRIRHVGSMYAGRTVAPLVRALEALIASGALRPDEVEIELIGDRDLSPAAVDNLVTGAVPIRLTPHVRFAEAVALMRDQCVLLSVQSEQHANLIPTKLFDYLCTGNPTLVLSPEASASWDVARSFRRCQRLDHESIEHNRAILMRLLAAWREGALWQESAVEDTANFEKATVGAAFARAVEDVLGSPTEEVVAGADDRWR